jgi:hypothetical protein
VAGGEPASIAGWVTSRGGHATQAAGVGSAEATESNNPAIPSGSPCLSGWPAVSRSLVVAAFSGPGEARGAITALERLGVSPNAIHVENPPGGTPQTNQRNADRRVVAGFTQRVVKGALVGGVCGVLVALLGLNLVHSNPSAEASVAAGLCGAVIGLVAGGFIWVAVGMPRSQPELDRFVFAHNSEVCVSVDLDGADRLESVTETLRTEGATSVERLPA